MELVSSFSPLPEKGGNAGTFSTWRGLFQLLGVPLTLKAEMNAHVGQIAGSQPIANGRVWISQCMLEIESVSPEMHWAHILNQEFSSWKRS